MKNINKIITLSALSSSLLLGANVPTIGDIEQEIKAPEIKKEKPSIPTIKAQEYKAPMIDSGKTILIKDFKITGNAHIPSAQLEQFFVEFKNKELTFNQLQSIATAITRYYREQGYFVARAYIPEQNILENNNTLEISVIEGHYGEFKLNNNSLVKDSVLQGMLDDAKSRDDVIATNTLERAMLIISDTPGVVVTSADVMPGREVGTSDFQIETQPSKQYDGYVLADNYGSRYTGQNRVMAGVNANSLLGYGDKLSLSALLSNGADLKNGRIAYSAPLAGNGLRGEISYSQTNYSLVGLSGTADNAFTGDAKNFEGKLSYPMIRTRLENLSSSLTVGRKDLNDEFENAPTNPRDSIYTRLELEYSKDYFSFGKNTKSAFDFTYTYGKLSFDNASDKSIDAAGANTNGNYSKVNLDLSHNIALSNAITLESSLKMQYAFSNKNLDGSEDFSVGGPYGVKLYPTGELNAENGYLFNIEAKYRLPDIHGMTNSVGVFFDQGRAWMANNTVGFEDRTLHDMGLGYYANYKNLFGKLHVAWDVNSADVRSEKVNNQAVVLVQAGISFSFDGVKQGNVAQDEVATIQIEDSAKTLPSKPIETIENNKKTELAVEHKAADIVKISVNEKSLDSIFYQVLQKYREESLKNMSDIYNDILIDAHIEGNKHTNLVRLASRTYDNCYQIINEKINNTAEATQNIQGILKHTGKLLNKYEKSNTESAKHYTETNTNIKLDVLRVEKLYSSAKIALPNRNFEVKNLNDAVEQCLYAIEESNPNIQMSEDLKVKLKNALKTQLHSQMGD